MSATEWTALTVAAIGAIGAVVLQALQMYFSFKRDAALKKDVTTAAVKAASVERKTDDLVRRAKDVESAVSSVSDKVDDNTKITQAGTVAAVYAAAENKEATKSMADNLNKKLNGGLDAALEAAIKPVRDALADHALQDEVNMKSIVEKLGELNRKVQR